MKKFIIVFTITVAVIFTSVKGQPGYNNYPGSPGYGPIYAQAFPYSFGYSYVSAGYGNQYHPLQSPRPQFGIAKVKAEQNSLGYEYSIHESGPNHHKHVHQTASTGGRQIVPLAAPIVPIIPQEQVGYHHPQQQHKQLHGASGYIPNNNRGYHQYRSLEEQVPLVSSVQDPALTLDRYRGGRGDQQYFYGEQDPRLGGLQQQTNQFPYAYNDNYGGQIHPGLGTYF